MITIVSGGLWGSEAKGAITGYIALHGLDGLPLTHCVRTGAVNAGHTVYHLGRGYAMQQLPCGWVNPEVELILGAGAYINPHILAQEVRLVAGALGQPPYKVAERLRIDYRAGLHLPAHTSRSTDSDRHHLMGATGKGCSEAIIDRIAKRGAAVQDPQYSTMTFGAWLARAEAADGVPQEDIDLLRMLSYSDTSSILNHAIDRGAHVLLEGTQGTLLDLYHGPYPYTTHKPTLPAQWMVEAGLSPSIRCPINVALVIRTYPIRVAGNSGPMPGEMSWVELARLINDRLRVAGGPPRVKEESLVAFEEATIRTAYNMRWGGVSLPEGSNGLNMHEWSSADRARCRVAVSELHKVALQSLPPETVDDLRRLLEFTTVTKKLRRVASLHVPTLAESFIFNRPTHAFVTFMNYLFPDLWDTQDRQPDAREEKWAGDLAMNLMSYGVQPPPADKWWGSTGPLTENIHPI